MRVLQLIDSLNPGGAEKMAVNFANEWANQVTASFLIATHCGGALEKQINPKVKYKIFKRSSITVFGVFFGVLWFIKKNRITHVQAHATSYKWSKWIKLIFTDIKFYWHDHNGNRINWDTKKNNHIISFSKYFDGVLACNSELEAWAQSNLKTHKIKYVPNFATDVITEKKTELLGEANKRIVCIANWRNPKNHLFLVNAFKDSEIANQGWSLHLVGKIYNDEYAEQLIQAIGTDSVNNIYYYNLQTDTNYILSQAQVGVLVSTYEGFPVTLLEYGLMGLCPIVSNVGYMPQLVSNQTNGWVIDPHNKTSLVQVFKQLPNNSNLPIIKEEYSKKVKQNFGANTIVQQIKTFWYD